MSIKPLHAQRYGKAKVEVYADKRDMGQAAAERAAAACAAKLRERELINLAFSTGASQFEFVEALRHVDIDWKKTHAFHLDEYVGISAQHPASFRLWLRRRVEEPLRPACFYYIEGDAADVEEECRRYEQLLRSVTIDLGFVGIGENGHIAFNDPPADFESNRWTHVVELDQACRRQQVGEGWFAAIEDVPKHAISLTVPAIMSFKQIISVVPDKRKAEAVRNALLGPISPACPASILRMHPNVTVFLDVDSALLLRE